MHAPDTHPDAHREQIRLLRAAGPTGRFQAARQLSGTVLDLARRRLRERMPDADSRELERALACQLYGERLTRELGVGGDPPP